MKDFDLRTSFARMFALVSPGAPRGGIPLPLEDRNDAPPHERCDPYVLVNLYKSAGVTGDARKRLAQDHSVFRRLQVELECRGAVVADALGRIDEMALRRGDTVALDLLADLWDADVDVVRVDGLEGELALIFVASFGDRVKIIDQSIVTTNPSSGFREWSTAFVCALVAAALVDPLLQLGRFWLLALVVVVTAVLHRAVRAGRELLRRGLRLFQVLEHLAETSGEMKPKKTHREEEDANPFT